MATLLQIYNAKYNSTLRNKVEAAILKASFAVQSEDVGTADHVARVACATKCLIDDSYLQKIKNAIMYTAATNGTIAADAENAVDGDVEWIVAYVWTNISKQYPPV